MTLTDKIIALERASATFESLEHVLASHFCLKEQSLALSHIARTLTDDHPEPEPIAAGEAQKIKVSKSMLLAGREVALDAGLALTFDLVSKLYQAMAAAKH